MYLPISGFGAGEEQQAVDNPGEPFTFSNGRLDYFSILISSAGAC